MDIYFSGNKKPCIIILENGYIWDINKSLEESTVNSSEMKGKYIYDLSDLMVHRDKFEHNLIINMGQYKLLFGNEWLNIKILNKSSLDIVRSDEKIN